MHAWSSGTSVPCKNRIVCNLMKFEEFKYLMQEQTHSTARDIVFNWK